MQDDGEGDDRSRAPRERALRGAVLSGDVAAWQAWYDEAYPGVYAFLRWRCRGSLDLLDDAVQETWLRAVKSVDRFDPDRQSFRAWACGIAGNVVREKLRQRNRERHRTTTLAGEPAARVHDGTTQSTLLHAALALLPDRYAQVLREKYLQTKAVAEIAAAWATSPKSIESLLTRARAALRDELTALEAEAEV